MDKAVSGQAANLLIFDGDDTLWKTEVLYDLARMRAAEIVAASGLDAEIWSDLQKSIDLENVKTMGLSRERFPSSSVEAYRQLAGHAANDVTAEDIWDASASVFLTPAEVVPEVIATLEALSKVHRLVLLTKGDRAVQHVRLRHLGFMDPFDAVVIVPTKSLSTFASICSLYDFSPSDSWSIGNSVRSDIIPAMEAGLHAVWLDAHVWEHEKVHGGVPEGVVVVDQFTQLIEIFMDDA